MLTMKQALLIMLKARLRDTKEQDLHYDHEYWMQQGRINTLEEIVELVEVIRD